MTAISASSNSSYVSPLQLLQKELAAEVSSGKVSDTDATALSSALTDIDQSLQSSRSDAGSSAPGDVKSKIDDLIASEVSSGKLTSDQAAELKDVFKTAFAGGPGGPGGAGGPPPGPPPSDGASSADSASSSSISDILKEFLETLQQQQQASSTSSYGAAGTTTSASFSALLIDYQT